jgi:hypothetical protein
MPPPPPQQGGGLFGKAFAGLGYFAAALKTVTAITSPEARARQAGLQNNHHVVNPHS